MVILIFLYLFYCSECYTPLIPPLAIDENGTVNERIYDTDVDGLVIAICKNDDVYINYVGANDVLYVIQQQQQMVRYF